MSGGTNALAKLKKEIRRARKDDAADDAGIKTAMLLVPLTVAVGLFIGEGSLFGLGVLGVLLALGSGLVAAVVHGFAQGFFDIDMPGGGWPAAFAGAGLGWYWAFEAWLPAAGLFAASLSLFRALWVRRKKALARHVKSALPVPVLDQLVALPKKLPRPVTEALNRALSCHAELQALLQSELADDGVLDADAMLGDASECVAEVIRRVELLQRLRRAGSDGGTTDPLTEQIVALSHRLRRALEAAVGYAAARGSAAGDELAEQAEQLQLTAAALVELEQELSEPPALTEG